MWQILDRSQETTFDLASSARELLEETMRSLILTIGGLWLIFQIVLTAYWTGKFDWHTWPLTILYLGLSGLVLYLLPRWLRIAQLLWLLGLAGIVTLALHFLKQPEIAFLYALVPFMAVVVTRWQIGVSLAAGIAGITAWLALGVDTPYFSPLYAAFITLGSAVAVAIGWASSQVVLTLIQWSLMSFARAQQQTEEARAHRAELAKLYKNLDQAYYQLERANAALVAARKVAEEAERFKTEFVTNVSHELRTPLNLIVGFTEMIMTSPESYGNVQLPGVYRGDIHSVYHSAQHLLALVDDVLDLARIEVGKIALAREHVDLHALVHETGNMVRDYVVAKGLELRLEVEEELPEVWADRLRIRQVLLNLLVNAARHTQRGWVALDVRQQNDELLIRVTDTGPGIPAGDQEKIFEEFRTTEQPFSEWHSGTGLGLPISKKFIELHNGRMGVDSMADRGASFWFTLPLMPAAQATAGAKETTRRYRPLVRLGATERIVVVVHDDPHVVPLLKRYVEGYQIVSASNLGEGLQLAEELKAMALIADAPHPLDVANEDLLVIRCPLPNTAATASNLGAREMLVKPVSRHELLAAVDRLGCPVNCALIVDDDPEVVRLFRRMLRARVPTHRCIEAYNGQEALASMRAVKPDLVLLDLIMPEVDGKSVLDEMKADPELAGIPVILVSARGQDHVNLRLPGRIEVNRSDGFELGEIVSTLTALFSSLAPGWQQLAASAKGSAEDSAGSPVSIGRPRHQASRPVEVH